MFIPEILPIVKEIHVKQGKIRNLMLLIKEIQNQYKPMVNRKFTSMEERASFLEKEREYLEDEKSKLDEINKLLNEIKIIGSTFCELANKDKELMKLYHALAKAEVEEDYVTCADVLKQINNYNG